MCVVSLSEIGIVFPYQSNYHSLQSVSICICTCIRSYTFYVRILKDIFVPFAKHAILATPRTLLSFPVSPSSAVAYSWVNALLPLELFNWGPPPDENKKKQKNEVRICFNCVYVRIRKNTTRNTRINEWKKKSMKERMKKNE